MVKGETCQCWNKTAALPVGCPPKLVSYRNNRNWNQNYFRHYPKQDVCFAYFALISKQGVLVFWNNRNSSKFVKISTFLNPHTISSVCFGCFYTGLKQRNKPKKKLFFVKNKPKNNRNRLSFGLFRFKLRKKVTVSRTPNRQGFVVIFSVCFDKVLFGSVVSKHRNRPKQTEKNVFWFCETNRKTTKTDWVETKIWLFQGHPNYPPSYLI
jgi:hypothetical protein